MRYEVLRIDNSTLTLEQLEQAFAVEPTLTARDALTAARMGWGFLARGLSEESAARLAAACVTSGFGAQALPESELPVLGERRALKRADCLPVGLVLYDALSQQTLVDWSRVHLVAAGSVNLMEYKRIVGETMQRTDGYGMAPADITNKETPHHRLVLELVLDDSRRFHVQAERFMYAYLGERLDRSYTANFLTLVRDVLGLAGQASVNAGAAALGGDPPQLVTYTHRNAFEQEMVWLLWRRKQQV